MIVSFKGKEAGRLFDRQAAGRIPPALHRKARMKLLMLDAAKTLEDLRLPPGNRLGKLKGRRSGQHSIRINDQWRVCFRWVNGDTHDVEIVDYH